MNARPLISFLCFAALSSGCVVHGDDHDDVPVAVEGDIDIAWSFAGQDCTEAPDVAYVRVSIPGETLEDAGTYECRSVANYEGIVLRRFRPGTYAVTVEAFDTNNVALFAKTTNVVVNGNVKVAADLAPIAGDNSYAYVSWSFAPSLDLPRPTCLQAGVDRVYVRVGGQDWFDAPCSEGFGANATWTGYLPAGAHPIELVGVSGSGASEYTVFHVASTVTTAVGEPRSFAYTLRYAGPALEWRLSDGSVALSCSQASVSTVYVNFKNTATGQYVFAGSGQAWPCVSGPAIYNTTLLPPGSYEVYVQGRSTQADNTLYRSNFAAPHVAVVSAAAYAGFDSTLALVLKP